MIVQKNSEGTFIAKPESGSVTEILNRMLRLDDIGYMDVYKDAQAAGALCQQGCG